MIRWYRDTLRIKSKLYKLIIECDDKNLLLEQNTSPEDLDETGRKIAEFVDKPFYIQET
jgi:hypothetical protein